MGCRLQQYLHSLSLRLHLLLITTTIISLSHAQGNSGHNGTSTASSDGSSGNVYLYVVRVDNYSGPSEVTLECDTRLSGVQFWREINGQTEQIQGDDKKMYMKVTPDREGSYYCTAGSGIRSEPPFIEIVAYPLQNKTVREMKTHTARLHDDITMPCVYTPGALYERYTIRWFKGLTPLDTVNDARFDIESDFSLVIQNVNAFDASLAYYCDINVESTAPKLNGYHSIGPSIRLMVIDSLTISQPPLSSAHLPSLTNSAPTTTSFTCTAYGLPPPSITWLHQGTKVTATMATNQIYSPPANTTMDSEGATVTRHLYIVDLQEDHSGLVECLVMQNEPNNGVAILSSSAGLTVLPSSFTPHLLPTSTGVELTFDLPALIPAAFSLIIYYYDNSNDNDLIGKSELIDPTFANSRKVDYVITVAKLPSVTVFSVRVSVKVGEMEGQLSEQSNEITITSANPSTANDVCVCDGETTATPKDNNTVQTILVIFIVLLIVLLSVAMGVALWGVVMMIKRKRRVGSKGSLKSRSRTVSGSTYRSRSRSYSRSTSRSRSRSRSYSRSSRSPSNYRSYRSDSDSKGGSVYKSESDDHKSRRRDNKTNESEAPHGSRGDPEGSYDDDYIAVKSAPADNIRSRTGSTAVAGHTGSVIATPLPSAPFEQPSTKTASANKENEYEELKYYKKSKRKRRTARNEGRDREGREGKEQEERSGSTGGRADGARGDVSLINRGGKMAKTVSALNPLAMTLDPALEEVSVA